MPQRLNPTAAAATAAAVRAAGAGMLFLAASGLAACASTAALAQTAPAASTPISPPTAPMPASAPPAPPPSSASVPAAPTMAGAISSASAAPVGLPAPAAVRAAIERIYAAQDAAVARKDPAGLFASYAPTFIGSNTKGQSEDLAADKADFANISAAAISLATRSAVQSVSMVGKSAVAVVKLHVNIVLPTRQPGVSGTVAVDSLLHDTWVHTAAGWKLTASKSLGEQDTYNGQPVNPNLQAPPPPAANTVPAEPPVSDSTPAPPAPTAAESPAAPTAPNAGTSTGGGTAPAAPTPPATAPSGS